MAEANRIVNPEGRFNYLQASHAVAVTPSDSTVISFTNDNGNGATLYVGTGGDLVVVTTGGETVTFSNFPSGSFLPVLVTKVKAATTALNIIALS